MGETNTYSEKYIVGAIAYMMSMDQLSDELPRTFMAQAESRSKVVENLSLTAVFLFT